jgi:hypothetical protein
MYLLASRWAAVECGILSVRSQDITRAVGELDKVQFDMTQTLSPVIIDLLRVICT